jgi:hypothetical protein
VDLKQPVVGIAATALAIVVSLGFISLFEFQLFAGWISYCLLCIIPMQIVIAVTWGAKLPARAAQNSQPLKGLLLVCLTVVVGLFVGVAYFILVGGSVSPPTPMLIQCAIVSVAVTFWAAIMWGGWPFNTIFKNSITAGLAMLLACYVVNYLLFRIFFNYAFLEGAPVYVPALDPQGMFNAWSALVFYMSALGIMFLMLHFDLWPLARFPALMQQPVLGIVWTAIALTLGGLAFYIGTRVMGIDVVRYFVRVPVPFIFGSIVMLNMLQGSVFAKLTQPLKGILSGAAAAAIGTVLALMYDGLSPMVSGPLPGGLPAYELETWLASALLGVTFPLMIFCAEFFSFWPLHKSSD